MTEFAFCCALGAVGLIGQVFNGYNYIVTDSFKSFVFLMIYMTAAAAVCLSTLHII